MLFKKRFGQLDVKVYENRQVMGEEAAREASAYMIEQLKIKEFLNVVFAAAPSQNEFLTALVARKGIDWTRINAFHMDEYIGLPNDAPQSFGNFLKSIIFSKVPFRSVNYLNELNLSPSEICEKYTQLLLKNPIDIVMMGIGENGHIAFNDPHVALFNDPRMVKVVALDDICRSQQVNDGCFTSIDLVPKQAITLTVPTLMSGMMLFCIVPGKQKANAVKNTLVDGVSEKCPATILRTHPSAALYCDKDSAAYIE